MKKVKLESLLFENEIINYLKKPFALAVDATKTNFILYNTKEYLTLKAKYEDLDNAYQKDKKFYDNALEVRTNQLDELEE